MVEHGFAVAEGQLIYVTDGDSIADVEVARTVPRRLIASIGSRT